MNDDHRQRKTLKALLVFEIAIDRDYKIGRGYREPQQLAVFDAGLAGLGNGFDLMAWNISAQRAGDALVKQHSHRQSGRLLPAPVLQSQSRA